MKQNMIRSTLHGSGPSQAGPFSSEDVNQRGGSPFVATGGSPVDGSATGGPPVATSCGPRPFLHNLSSFWVRLTWVLWVVLVVLAVGRVVLYYRSTSHRGSYPVFADGGRHWLHGEPLYDSANPNSLTVFRYSPLTALSCVPLALVADPVGSALLRAANLAVFGLGFWWWGRTVLPRDLSRDQRALAWLLCLGMGCVSMTEVQLNLLTGGFILITLAAVSEARWNLAALAMSLACCLKAYPVALALVLVVIHPRRFAGRWLAALLLCLALPFLLQQPDYVWRQYGDWLKWGLNQRRPEEVPFQDVLLFCQRWLTPISTQTYLLLEVVSGAAIAGTCLLRRWQGLPPQELLNAGAGLCCGWMMAFGPATESLTYVQLAPVVAVFTVLAWVTPNKAWLRALVTVSCLLLTLSQLQLLLPLHKPLHYLAAQPFAALLFMLTAGLKGRSRRVRFGDDSPPITAPAGRNTSADDPRAASERPSKPSSNRPIWAPA